MLQPEILFAAIMEKYPNSYYAEDLEKVIIGVDVIYFDTDSVSYDEIEARIIAQEQEERPAFAGYFGVLTAQFISQFENIPQPEKENYCFPDALFADAQMYVYYSKEKKQYETYGDIDLADFQSRKAYDKRLNTSKQARICTDLEEEKASYFSMIKKAQTYIKAGDIFQVVPSQQLHVKTAYDSFAFYIDLAKNNPSPYMYYFPTPYGDIVGSSPEVLVKKEEKQIYVAPIAGTRRRGKDAREDALLAQDLLSDPKECAEHRMLVDLARNDVGRVSEVGSVRVENLLHIEYFQNVMHIVSDVYGTIKDEIRPFDLVSSVFPAGTLSGAPKIRALEIISELEPVKRNVYGGAIGFFHGNGDIQLAIVIRTAFFAKKEKADSKVQNVYLQSGGGIVYDSNCEDEYREIVIKRASLYNLLELEGGK